MVIGKETYSRDTLKSISRLLTSKDKAKLRILFLFQIISSLLDLVGIFLIGVIGSITINGIQSRESNQTIENFLNYVNLGNSNLQTRVAVLGVLTASIFVVRTIASLFFTKKTLNFLSRRAAAVSGTLLDNVLHSTPDKISNRTIQEIVFASTYGIDSLIIRVIGSAIVALSDLFLLLIIFIGLLIYNPGLAFSVLLVFGSVSFLTYTSLNKKSYILGTQSAKLNIEGNSKIVEALSAYRELYVRDKINFYSELLRENRNQLANSNASAALLPNISKYLIEGAVILGTLVVSAILFAFQDANSAISGMAVYLAAASRVAPGALRIQQSVLTIKNNIGASDASLSLLSQVRKATKLPKIFDKDNLDSIFTPTITAADLNYKYDKSEKYVINNLSFKVEAGEMMAIVGPSGSGKSTLVDLILGILKPAPGIIEVSGLEPSQAIEKWPGLISYVPQSISIFKGSLRNNLLIGYQKSDFKDEFIYDVVRNAGLEDFVNEQKEKIEFELTENGSNISGGQRQKIGIARALLTNPKMIILDEATSSLDSLSENEIIRLLNGLRSKVTLVIVAHRLSTIKNANKIVYIDLNGNSVLGTFKELIEQVSDFKEQAKILGI
jgi:ABC-type multidrug transport system fused ATPase/permease subunit